MMKNKLEFDIEYLRDRKDDKPIIHIIINANINGILYNKNSFAYAYEAAVMDKDHFPWRQNKIKDMLHEIIEDSINKGNFNYDKK